MMDSNYRKIYSRNIGVFTEDEQEKLRNTTVAIAGMGGVGGLLAERLIRLGVGKLQITASGTYEESNLNRQFGSSMLTIGHNKAKNVFSQLQYINPQAAIDYTETGIKTEEDAVSLVKNADVVLDEMDYRAWKESILLQRAARKSGVYYLFTSALGFGALSVIFSPRDMTLEEFNRLPSNVNLDDIKTISVPQERILPVVPSYATVAMSYDTIQEIIQGKKPVPTCSIGVGLTSILAASDGINIVLNRKEIITAPRYTYVDLLDQKFIIGTVP
jgi:tRNA threonylcarbamoyladenosine dehydratase